ncbi:uncharacterized protein LOC119437640 isoform X2 [Dermacentor silvarum]|uniref:uncharacterized protein LOC119437640 isoform X2 n=1 Tax=Dermacentor silvarum TaxID=543639 RepID=UPI002100D457|nr:uncharacterized protein LOC119437640 isoform X2 [Dermacentor silvarum]
MINSIHRYVDDIGTVDEIKRWSFNILSFNMLCKENGLYYPLQLGLVDYSIEQGFIRAFHKFIDPGPIPLGFASAAKDHRFTVDFPVWDILPLLCKLRTVVGEISHAEAENILNSALFDYELKSMCDSFLCAGRVFRTCRLIARTIFATTVESG